MVMMDATSGIMRITTDNKLDDLIFVHSLPGGLYLEAIEETEG